MIKNTKPVEVVVNNQYILEKAIGKGQFGLVYKGKNTINVVGKENRNVAVKFDFQNTQIIKHEAKMLFYLFEQHVSNIPLVFWFGVSFEPFFKTNLPCLVISYYDCSLTTYMKNNEITKTNLAAMMILIINILENIHKKGVIHRDIKPDNFMIKQGDIVLIDFGLSTFYVNENNEHVPLMLSKNIVGTPLYISPNVHCGVHSSRRDDLISLGYVYFKMFTGFLEWENVGENDLKEISFSFSLKDFSLRILSKEQIQLENILEEKHQDNSTTISANHIYNTKNQTMCFFKKKENIKKMCDMINHSFLFTFFERTYSLSFCEEPPYHVLKNIFVSFFL